MRGKKKRPIADLHRGALIREEKQDEEADQDDRPEQVLWSCA